MLCFRATTVRQKRHNVTSYKHCLPCSYYDQYIYFWHMLYRKTHR